jgi:hypothetical protein
MPNVHLFWTIENAKEKLMAWQVVSNHNWPRRKTKMNSTNLVSWLRVFITGGCQ